MDILEKNLTLIYTMCNEYGDIATIEQDEETGRYYAFVEDTPYTNHSDLTILVDKMERNGFHF